MDYGTFAPAFVALVIVAMLIAFVSEWRPPEITAGLAVSALLVTGILDMSDVLGVLSSSAPATIGAMFVLSAALIRTGAVERFAGIVTQGLQSGRSCSSMLAATSSDAVLPPT